MKRFAAAFAEMWLILMLFVTIVAGMFGVCYGAFIVLGWPGVAAFILANLSAASVVQAWG